LKALFMNQSTPGTGPERFLDSIGGRGLAGDYIRTDAVV
jgi:hypothetical protein